MKDLPSHVLDDPYDEASYPQVVKPFAVGHFHSPSETYLGKCNSYNTRKGITMFDHRALLSFFLWSISSDLLSPFSVIPIGLNSSQCDGEDQ